MIKKVYEFAKVNRMLEPGDRIVVGLSGGADSVCLLKVLIELGKKKTITLHCIHLNHMIRGEEAVRDEEYCVNMCKELNVPIKVVRRDVPAFSREHGLTMEEAGRKIRYQEFEILASEINANKIAVAHHQNDQAETVLFNMFRGTGIRGLAGIGPVNGNIIRPLLSVTRREIEEFLNKNNVEYMTDSTNNCNDYIRNRIRNEILPVVSEHINSDCIGNINQAALICAKADVYIRKQARTAYLQCVKEEKGIYKIIIQKFCEYDEIIREYIVREIFEKIYTSLKDVSFIHISGVCGLLNREVGKIINLPANIVAVKSYEEIVLKESTDVKMEKVPLPQYMVEIIPWEKSYEIEKNDCTKYFDYDKIKFTLEFRTRKTGDYLTIDSHNGKKKLKDYFIDMKVPKEERDNIPVLADGNHILWVVGYRISEYYKISESTKQVVKVSVRENKPGGSEDGRSD